MSKSVNFKTKFILAVAIIFIISTFFNVSKIYASSEVLKVIAGDKIYSFSDYEVIKKEGYNRLKHQNNVVEGIYLDTLISPIEPELIFTGKRENPIKITDEKTGRGIDRVKLNEDIIAALNNGNKVVRANFIKVYPSISKDDLINTTVKRVSYTTYFGGSTENRKFNIKLASQKINGYKLGINEEFSFNKVVGVRSEENGFKSAKIILNGEYVDGVGGGVCQVSTTLYNCALLSGLKITEQHSHSLQISYEKPSFDAMVNSFSSDLKFVNTTNYPIYILSFYEDNSITFSIYGEKQEEVYDRVSVIVENLQSLDEEIINDDELFVGQTKILQHSKLGIKSEGYLIKYINGERVKSLLIRKDVYGSVRGKKLVGTKTA